MAETEQPAHGHGPPWRRDAGDPRDLAQSFSEVADAVVSTADVTVTLQRVVHLAVETIDGCDFAGIFLSHDGRITTPAHTDPFVANIDAAQHRSGEGPCLDVIADGGTTRYADDLTEDTRWPVFGPLATATGIRSVLAVRLTGDGVLGALNLYARYPRAFGVIDRAGALILAVMAGVALASAEAYDDQVRRADNLQAALVTRELIGQAEGILMERERVSADQAFDILRRASQHLNVKLRDVAQHLVDTGENLPTGPSASW